MSPTAISPVRALVLVTAALTSVLAALVWQPTTATVARATAPATVTAAAGLSSAKALPVRLHAEMRLPGRKQLTVPAGSKVTVSATPAAARRGTTVELQRSGDIWETIAAVRSRAGGKVTLKVPTDNPGRQTFRLVAADRPARISRPVTVLVVDQQPSATNPAAGDESAAPATGPAGPATAYSLFDTGRPGAVFRWDPCTPVRYRVNLAGAPAATATDVSAAFRRLSAATGMTFSDLGATDYAGTAGDPGQQAWPADTDLLVTVADEASSPHLAGETVGYATISRSRWSGADARILRAEVVLEREFLSSAGGHRAGGPAESLLLHELGHAVGLDHVDDPSQLMYPQLGDARGYQNGDLAGLSRVGAGAGCLG